MKRLQVILLMLCLVVAVPAQKKTSAQRKATTTAKSVSKKQPAKKQPAKKKPAKKATNAQPAKKQQPVTVKGLQSERQQLQKQMKEQERRLRQNERDVKNRLQSLMIINTEINDKRKIIDTIRHDINVLDGNIQVLDTQLKNLEKELDDRKQRFMKSVRYMHRNRSIQNQLMFVFSAKNFSQMYRGEQEKKALEGKQVEQQNVVNSLQKQQKTIQTVLDQQRKKEAALNAQIDKLIAEEIARAKARAEAERKKKAAEEARKKQQEELARKKAAAEAAARENARRIKEAREKEEKAKAEARAAARKSAQEKAAAEKAARDAENARRAAERKAVEEEKAHKKEMAAAKKKSEEEWAVSSEDRRLSGNFESNRGRFPMPITGPYKIVSTQGQNRVEGLKGTTMKELRGIELKGQPGAQARCIFDGEVSGVARYGDAMIVIVRHGTYLSVYSNLSSVNVSRVQKVSARQAIGAVSSQGTMQFQLRRLNGALLNPLSWVSR